MSKGVQTLVANAQPEFVKRRQVGILGGNFNPVHQTHLILADQVGRLLGLDQVYLMPEFLPPHVDEKSTIASEHRLAMLQLAVADNPLLAIEPIELQRKGKSYTYETMKELRQLHPDTDFYFIIGGDMVAYLPKWYKVDELMQLVQFVGVRRPGYPEVSDYPLMWVDVPLMDLSSTMIRQKVAQGCSIRYFVPEAVRAYIEEKGLYVDE
ncbi:nicotinate-nucleotide adenylyltransferase [Enterococcus asini]|uniref:nicotinate-nucleotide adenylyltransferase n=1 Tax=Enterococcus asini TaxID=57732 RepID=UPI00288E49C6|nr:nicotinate-nucleotide adenylyltransferase [Enterococcus asini]MDT2764237.1 nicotinate-nucleotide adenylyltransferase [Enterococcus asini]